jgi:hypothetical protein
MAEISTAHMKSPPLTIAGKAHVIEAFHFSNVDHYCMDEFASSRTINNIVRR